MLGRHEGELLHQAAVDGVWVDDEPGDDVVEGHADSVGAQEELGDVDSADGAVKGGG